MNLKKNRLHYFEDEKTNIGIDFDGVIHKNSKGFNDGTIYDTAIKGTKQALKVISQRYTIIVFTAKAKSDRPLVDGKTGKQLVWEWLKEKKLDKYITEVTSEKPRAVAYIDDKAIKFINWSLTLEAINEI